MFRVFQQCCRGFSAARPHLGTKVPAQFHVARRPASERVFSNVRRAQNYGKASLVLRSGIYGTIYLSIALLVTDESLDWATRQNVGIEAVQEITHAESHEEQLDRFWALGPALLKAHSGQDAEHHEPLKPSEESGLAEDLVVRLMTAPDPEVPGQNLVLCQAAFVEEEVPDFYVATHSDRMSDAAHSLFPEFEQFTKDHNATKGALLIIHPDGNWYCLYYDGKRWLNMIFLEWQTAASMGIP